MMNKALLSILAVSFLFTGCLQKTPIVSAITSSSHFDTPLLYSINLEDRSDDVFRVSLQVDDLETAHDIYQFASTAPGTYQVMDIGRFVHSFEAFDEHNNPIRCEHVSTNQWRISNPVATRRIDYTIADIWDTPVKENPIYSMASSSLEDDYAQILPHSVLGYPTGMQHRPLKIKLKQPADWLVGTSLKSDDDGNLLADNYDHAVDSPILTGKLTYASMEYRGGLVEFYTYSKSGRYKSQMLLDETRDVVESVGAFLGGFPVDRYTFLFVLDDNGSGAWEHSYSSNYALPDSTFELDLPGLDGITTHEIFHMVTPLNIHSELIETFNFVKPVPSRHLWLYEASTEWAAQTMPLRSGNITLEKYFEETREKLIVSAFMKPDMSLTDIAMRSYTKEGAKQYGNIYMRGSLTISLLDIRLLELSGGKRGMREVLLALAQKYGPSNAFSEEHFFDEFVSMTNPEIKNFFTRYIEGHEPLPMEEYFGKLGITYIAKQDGNSMEPWLGFQPAIEDETVLSRKVSSALLEQGLQEEDILLAIDDIPISLSHMSEVSGRIKSLAAGDTYRLKVKQGGSEREVSLTMLERIKDNKHVFLLNPEATPEQVALREAWLINLPL